MCNVKELMFFTNFNYGQLLRKTKSFRFWVKVLKQTLLRYIPFIYLHQQIFVQQHLPVKIYTLGIQYSFKNARLVVHYVQITMFLIYKFQISLIACFSDASCEYFCVIETILYILNTEISVWTIELLCGLAADVCRILYLQMKQQIVLYLVNSLS